MYVGGCAFSPIAIEIGDVRIGAVEIQDQTSSKRANVVTSGGQDRLAVDAFVAASPNPQVQHVETVTALAGSATFTGATRDCLNYAGFGVSVYLARGANDTNVDMIVEDSHDGGTTWRTVDTYNIALSATNLNELFSRVYSPVRRHMRVRLVNNTANALATTEAVVMLKPIP